MVFWHLETRLLARVASVALAVAASFPGPVGAAEGDPMERALDRYFEGEVREAASFLGVGAGTAFFGGAVVSRSDFGIGLGSALLSVSAIELGAGIVLLARTPDQVAELRALYRRDPGAYRREEGERMERVNLWFDVYMGIEIGLMGLGGASILFGALDDRPGFVGAGVGLAHQASAMLTFDLLAARRADVYTEAISALPVAVRPVAWPGGAALRGEF